MNGLTVLALIALVAVLVATVAMVVREAAAGQRDMARRLDAFRAGERRHQEPLLDAYRGDDAPSAAAERERELVDA